MSKKPDNVVWSEDRGYYANVLPYGSDLGAPSIKPENVTAWKQAGVSKVNHYFDSRFQEIREKYSALVEEYRWNDILYKAKYNFEPVIGRTYYLYVEESGLFLSLICPEEWKNSPDFLGSFQLDSENRWNKIN